MMDINLDGLITYFCFFFFSIVSGVMAIVLFVVGRFKNRKSSQKGQFYLRYSFAAFIALILGTITLIMLDKLSSSPWLENVNGIGTFLILLVYLIFSLFLGQKADKIAKIFH